MTFNAFAGRPKNRSAIEATVQANDIPSQLGGGVREIADIRNLLNAGADRVSINTSAVQNPEFVRKAAERFGMSGIEEKNSRTQ